MERIEKGNYERTAVSEAYRPTATYSDFTVGVVYAIRESEDAVTNIDYLPAAKDCTVDAISSNGGEEVVGIIYYATAKIVSCGAVISAKTKSRDCSRIWNFATTRPRVPQNPSPFDVSEMRF